MESRQMRSEEVHFPKPTACPWKWMFGRLISLSRGWPMFRGVVVRFRVFRILSKFIFSTWEYRSQNTLHTDFGWVLTPKLAGVGRWSPEFLGFFYPSKKWCHQVLTWKKSWKSIWPDQIIHHTTASKTHTTLIEKIQGSLYHQAQQCTSKRKILQDYQTFALFDPPKMGHLMTPEIRDQVLVAFATGIFPAKLLRVQLVR